MTSVSSARNGLPLYDSDQRKPPLVEEAVHLWQYRGLLRLLVVRDLTLRYKRSLLGVWWTLLNPMLLTGVMWLVFSAIFRFEIPGGVPYILYLTSGVLLITFFAQGLNTVGQSLVASSSVISKVYVPPEVFAVSAAAAAGSNFLISLVPLLVIALLTGWGIPLSVLLVPIPALSLLMLVTGLGLLVATAAIRFADTLDIAALAVVLVGYLTPTFYPITIVPEQYRDYFQFNPLYSYLLIFRDLAYGGQAAPWWAWLVMIASSLGALGLGTYVFSRRWRTLAAML
jgi:ABC-type polysaccharide/polyol phosphate export permease